MLDLQAGVHLHEPEPVGPQPVRAVHDELDRARPGIADGLGRAHRRTAHRGPHLGRHAGGRGLLDHLLVAALQTAVAFIKMHGAGAVAEDLHLDMARLQDVFLDQHGGVAEGALRLGPGAFQRIGKGRGVVHAPHALAAAPRHGLDQHRVADPRGLRRQMVRVLIRAVIAGHDRHARLLHQRLGRVLEAHRPDRRRRRPDEDQPRRHHRIDEVGVLGQEAIARMDRLRAGGLGRRDDPVAPQIAVGGRGPAQMHGLIGHLHMARIAVGVGIDRDRRHAQAAAGVDDAAGDLAPVGDQDLVEHVVPLTCGTGRTASAGWVRSGWRAATGPGCRAIGADR